MKRFTFYDLYWKLTKNEKEETIGTFIKNVCEFMFENKEIEMPKDDKQAYIWSSVVEFLERTKELESEGKIPKTFNKKMKHFAFEENYYMAIKLMSIEESGIYLKALCGYMFDGVEPKKLKPPIDGYFEVAKLKLELCKVRINSGKKGGTTERKLLNSNEINERHKTLPYYMTFDDFMKKHPKVEMDIYKSREYLLKDIDWDMLSMGMEANVKYKSCTSLFTILTHKKEIYDSVYGDD